MRLIDADKLIEELGIEERCSECQYADGIRCAGNFVDACMAIFDAPTVKAEDDAVSRQAVLDIINNCYDGGADPFVAGTVCYDKIKQLPSAQRWIPCSERLPEDIKPVLITWKNTDPASYYQYIVGKHFIGSGHFCNGKWFWYSSTCEDYLAEYGRCDVEEIDEAIEVIAWMPLPEPYKGEQE